jgi:hypothetical protein
MNLYSFFNNLKIDKQKQTLKYVFIYLFSLTFFGSFLIYTISLPRINSSYPEYTGFIVVLVLLNILILYFYYEKFYSLKYYDTLVNCNSFFSSKYILPFELEKDNIEHSYTYFLLAYKFYFILKVFSKNHLSNCFEYLESWKQKDIERAFQIISQSHYNHDYQHSELSKYLKYYSIFTVNTFNLFYNSNRFYDLIYFYHSYSINEIVELLE